MVWFATPGSSNVGSSWGGWGSEQTTKQPDPVSSAAPFSFSSVLGRQIPIVVGTYPVDGIPVIGGAATVTNISGYTQVKLTSLQGLGDVGGTGWLNNDPFSRVALVPIQGASQVASMGYLLAYDPFGDGYKLVQLKVNDEVVFDAEKGFGASTTFRFYGGTQTEADPITKAVIGTNAGAWQNFAMVYLDGFSATSPPTVKAVISNAATETGTGGDIAWTGEAPSGILNAFPNGSAYDPAEGVIYQIFDPTDIPSLTQIYLAVLDIDTLQERYRVPLEGSGPYAVGRDVNDSQLTIPIAMAGTGLLLIQLYGAEATPRLSGIYDSANGHLIASQIDTANMIWLTVQQFGQLWVFIGHNFDAGMGVTGIFDPAEGTFEVDPEGIPARYLVVNGRVTTEFTSFFTATSSFTGDADIYEMRFNGDAWTSTLLHSLTGLSGLSASVLWFDPATGYLVVGAALDGSINRWLYIDPEDGSVIDTFDTAKMGFNSVFTLPRLHNRLISLPGFVMMLWSDGDPDEPAYEIITLDIQAKTISTFADEVVPRFTVGEFSYLIADQGRSLWMSALGEYVWTVHRQPNTIPGSVSLRWMLTKIMSLAGYTPEELTFDGPDWGGDPDPDPDDPDPIDPAVGALDALDFLAETYTVHGSTAAAVDVIDKPERVGASGLEIPLEEADGVVSAIGDCLADLLTMYWTVVIEWEELTTDGATYLLYLADVDDNHTIVIERSTAFTGLRVDTHEASNNTRNVEINTSHGPGVHKIAVTRTDAFISMSCDGSDVVTQVVAPISMNPMATASFGGDPTEGYGSNNNTFIRKFYLLPPRDDAYLPGLSV
ncbi:hypothetical protein NKI61_23230 [Mesorhizobium sp. M0514]|uniref:hypothetical protein n=1 Tax=Mesorhizobium sp. M0514 TaxID=2956955 RepID=UPI0033383C1F